jgi:phosphoenolpyruvate carboxylase
LKRSRIWNRGPTCCALSVDELAQLTAHLREWPFVHYVLTNVESSLASSDPELMRLYASMVPDAPLRERMLGMILEEWELTHRMLERVRGKPMASRRPRMLKTLELRAQALRVLHRQQIALLQDWRGKRAAGDDAAADGLLPDLLLSINAIASGLRTTG